MPRQALPSPAPPSGSIPTSPLPLQELVPAPVSAVSPPPPTSTAPRTEMIEASDRIEVVGILESGARTPVSEGSRGILVKPGRAPAVTRSCPDPQGRSHVGPGCAGDTPGFSARNGGLLLLRVMQSCGGTSFVREKTSPPSRRNTTAHHGLPGLLWWANRATVAWPQALVAGTRIIIPPIESA